MVKGSSSVFTSRFIAKGHAGMQLVNYILSGTLMPSKPME